MKIDFPYLVSDNDRHGNKRFYFRKKGQPKIRIRAEPGTAEFHRLYEEAAIGTPKTGLRRAGPGSMAHLINAYLGSTDFNAELAVITQKNRRLVLSHLADVAGDKPFAALTTARVHAWMDARADRPESANNLLKTLRSLFKFALSRGLTKYDPTLGIHKVRIYSEGFHTWTVDEVKQYLAKHEPRSKARLALFIALFTGLRRSNVATLGQQHLHSLDGNTCIVIKTAKSRRKALKDVVLPMLPLLAEEIEHLPKSQTAFLQTDYGKPFSVQGLGNAFKRWCVAADLPHCTIHGLRKAGATFSADNGASDRQLMAIYGWSTAEQANVYTERRDRTLLARSARDYLKIEGLK